MKKRGRGLTINLHLSNRLSYTLIAIFILVVIGVGVYALAPGVIPNPGHNINEMSVPSGCTSGQILTYDGTNWTCVNSIPTCSANQILYYTGSAWACHAAPLYSETDPNVPYKFGGMYTLGVAGNPAQCYSNCVFANPYTGGCSCPGGYSAARAGGTTTVYTTNGCIYYCYK